MSTITEIMIKIFVETILITGMSGFIFTRREERMKKQHKSNVMAKAPKV
ncbi:MAG: hypothetical protein ABI472_17330 [Ginsengibacter sp.]